MHSLEVARQLILSMAPNADDIEEIRQSAAGNSWGLGFSDESIMTVEWVAEPTCFVLTFFLGMPAVEKRLDVCELLLSLSQMSAETGGVRGGMAADGEFTLICDLAAAPITEVEFRRTIMNFAALGREWKHIVRCAPTVSE